MEIQNIFFTKLNESLITAHLTSSDKDDEFSTIRAMGVSRKQCIFNFCKEGLLSWDLFAEAKSLAMAQRDPRFVKAKSVSRNNFREQKLADICDDMNCSVTEAIDFLDNDVMPRGW